MKKTYGRDQKWHTVRRSEREIRCCRWEVSVAWFSHDGAHICPFSLFCLLPSMSLILAEQWDAKIGPPYNHKHESHARERFRHFRRSLRMLASRKLPERFMLYEVFSFLLLRRAQSSSGFVKCWTRDSKTRKWRHARRSLTFRHDFSLHKHRQKKNTRFVIKTECCSTKKFNSFVSNFRTKLSNFDWNSVNFWTKILTLHKKSLWN